MRGLISATLFVLSLCVACADGKTPTTPTPGSPHVAPPAAYDGAWSGTFTITRCGGRRHCVFSIGEQSPFTLRLSRTGTRVSGVFQAEWFTVPVEGVISEHGSLSLRGVRLPPGPESATVEVTAFTSASAELTQAELTYELRYPESATTGTNSRHQSISGRVTQVMPGAVTAPTSFQGTWRGTVFLRDCSTVGWLSCWPDERLHEYVVTIVLTQSGDRVSGTFSFPRQEDVTPVTGTVAGNTATFDPVTLERPVSSARDVLRLERAILTRDGVGQLTGSLRYVRETIWDAALNRQPFVSSYEGDVSGVLIP